MSLRERLTKLEGLVKPPAGSDCIYRKMPPNTDPIGDFIRAKWGDQEAEQRLEVWKTLGVCGCEACQEKRRENDANPECQEFSRFFEARYGKYARRGANDSSARVCEPASDSAGVLSPPRPADEASAVSGAVSNNNPTGDLP